MNKPMSDTKSFEVLTASPVRLSSSSPGCSCQSWSDEEKARIIGDTCECVGDCAVKLAGSIATFYVAPQGDCLLRHWRDRRAARSGSRLQTAKMNDVDPLAWLALTLQRIAEGWPISQIEKLMPWNYKI